MSRNQENRDDVPASHWQTIENALDDHHKTHRRIRRALRRQRAFEKSKKQIATGPPIVFLTDLVARQTSNLLGAPSREKKGAPVVYWFGFECGDRACVTTIIVPEETSRGDAVLASAVANEEVFSAIVGASLIFLGQIYVREAQADLSGAERSGASETQEQDMRFEGSFSIEAPPEALAKGALDLEKCAVFRQVKNRARHISSGLLREHLRVIPGYKDLRKRNEPSRPVISPPPDQMHRGARID